jgi:ribosomal protein S18 acetylase RimI-like enzyme
VNHAAPHQRPTPEAAPPIRIRAAGEDDVGFVLDSWLRSFRDAWPNCAMPMQVYYEHYRPIAMGLLQRDGVRGMVACRPDQPSRLYGYVVAEHAGDIPVLHYLGVKRAYRGVGIAAALARAVGIVDDAFVFTFKGPFAKQLTRGRPGATHIEIEEFLKP